MLELKELREIFLRLTFKLLPEFMFKSLFILFTIGEGAIRKFIEPSANEVLAEGVRLTLLLKKRFFYTSSTCYSKRSNYELMTLN